MLMNLLPGLPELRAPLAAGDLWLLGLWLMLADDVPGRADAAGFWRRFFKAMDTFTAIGQAAALTFAAYLLGSFVSDAFQWLWRLVRIGRLRLMARWWPRYPPGITHRGTFAGRTWLERAWPTPPRDVYVRTVARASVPISQRSVDVVNDDISGITLVVGGMGSTAAASPAPKTTRTPERRSSVGGCAGGISLLARSAPRSPT
jgi:hypothetical protein